MPLGGVEAVRRIASLLPQRDPDKWQRNGTLGATLTGSTTYTPIQFNPQDRRTFIGGSDARIIMGNDEAVLLRLWREKRGEIEPEDLTDNLMVQLGSVTEEFNRAWYQRNTGHVRF